MPDKQLFLFDPEDTPKVRVRPAIDPELRKRKLEAKRQIAARVKLLPAVALFIATDGRESAYSPSDPKTDVVPPTCSLVYQTEIVAGLSYSERLRRKRVQLKERKDKLIRRRARKIFALCDLPPEWIRPAELAAMDDEIRRAAKEVQSNWGANEERKRRRGLNATEKDPYEHWTPPFASTGESCGNCEQGEDWHGAQDRCRVVHH